MVTINEKSLSACELRTPFFLDFLSLPGIHSIPNVIGVEFEWMKVV